MKNLLWLWRRKKIGEDERECEECQQKTRKYETKYGKFKDFKK